MTTIFQNWNINIFLEELDNYLDNKKSLFPEFLVWYANEDNQLFLLSTQKFYSYSCLSMINDKIKYYKDNFSHNETFEMVDIEQTFENEFRNEYKWIYDLLEEDLEKTKNHQKVIFLYRNHQYFLYQTIPVVIFISFLCGYYIS